MGNGIHISQKSKVRRSRKKTEQEVTLISGKYVQDFIIALSYVSSGNKFTRVVDFLPLFQQYVKGDNLKYFALANFKKFIVKTGNIYWGKNEDVIFPSAMLFGKMNLKDSSEEILYVM